MFKNNAKANPVEPLVASRLDAMEKRLDEFQQPEPVASKTTVSDASSLWRAFELVQNAPGLVNTMMRENIIRVRIDTWPSSFAAVLIDAGVQCDESRREAVRQYVEVFDDLKRHQSQLSQAHGKLETALKDSVARWERQLKYRKDTLDNLGVRVEEVPLGSPFDPDRHTAAPDAYPANGTVSTDCSHEHHTIAAVHHPLFTWKDENGSEQCVAADVTVFLFNG